MDVKLPDGTLANRRARYKTEAGARTALRQRGVRLCAFAAGFCWWREPA